MYKLIGKDGKQYDSETPGTLGGNDINPRDKIYGRLDCPAALRTLRNPRSTYPRHRVFFADEATARAAGYRPCGTCMHEQYRLYQRYQRGEITAEEWLTV